ncbi:hypothetical protein ABT56_07915 [Photobacterium aquae]|uniref:Dinitrogenase iron-molybdenum cofactor biosynthesis domain-containing protein n=1 Tax=Photobacterium aquae TaxID=1195763 RepID=A0A0J1H4Y0_9GAMM|nr:NifB/NifX family molybdenum-iron cluster-binding protein [Photobacterium aquae]KLV06793.1 hypothetical protein ABT56_07915 [Photobacterium aquae]
MSLAIAVTARREVAGHFGKAAAFLLFDDKGVQVAEVENSGSREVGCKHKKLIQRQLAEYGVTHLVVGNIGQRSLARLLNAGWQVSRVAPRSPLEAIVSGKVAREALTAAEQGRPCKREKGDCGCGCGSKKKAAPAKIGMKGHAPRLTGGLFRLGGFTR